MHQNIRKMDRFLGCFAGGAVGDALGYPVEFLDEKSIWNQYGPTGIQTLAQAGNPAVITDDTQMTLFNINGILYSMTNGMELPEALWLAHREWLGTQGDTSRMADPAAPAMWLYRHKSLHAQRAPGLTCLSAIRTSETGGTISEPVNNSKGCGAVMKAAPFGLMYSYDSETYRGDYLTCVCKTAAALSAQTHGHPLGYLSGAYLALILAEIVQYRPGKDVRLEDAIRRVNVPNSELNQGIARAIDLALNPQVSDLNAIHDLGEGWVSEEALYIAVFCAVRHQNDFAAALRAAVNHRGDSDSTGSICGNILGAWLGIGAVEQSFDLKNLEMRDLIEEIAEDFYWATEHGIPKTNAHWDRKYRHGGKAPGGAPLHSVGIRYTPLTQKAINLCFDAHKNQKDKSGLPYVFHPFHLAEQMETEEEICVALLHDVIEDTDYTSEDLRNAGFPVSVLEALELMTHDPSVPYMDYVIRLRENPIARKVKKADLLHNSDLNRLKTITDKDRMRHRKYLAALELLQD